MDKENSYDENRKTSGYVELQEIKPEKQNGLWKKTKFFVDECFSPGLRDAFVVSTVFYLISNGIWFFSADYV
jgi:hypothetical protein